MGKRYGSSQTGKPRVQIDIGTTGGSIGYNKGTPGRGSGGVLPKIIIGRVPGTVYLSSTAFSGEPHQSDQNAVRVDHHILLDCS